MAAERLGLLSRSGSYGQQICVDFAAATTGFSDEQGSGSAWPIFANSKDVNRLPFGKAARFCGFCQWVCNAAGWQIGSIQSNRVGGDRYKPLLRRWLP